MKHETEEMTNRQWEKEQRELERRKEELKKPKGRFYSKYLFVIIALIIATDEIASNIAGYMQTEIATNLFAGKLSLMAVANVVAIPLQIIAVFYKTLCDKYGRKPFLWISCMGMGLAMFCVYLSGDLSGAGGIGFYLLGTAFVMFFISNDVHQVYILETAPEDKRSTYVSLFNFFATLAVLIIPVLRKLLMGSDTTKWNRVYLIPSLLCIVIAAISMMQTRETDAFLKNRIEFLSMTAEERKRKMKEDGADSQVQGGIIPAFKMIFRIRQIKWLTVSGFLFGIAGMCCYYYSTMMNVFYDTEQVTTGLSAFAVASALCRIVIGVLADKGGRKKTFLFGGILCVASLVGAYIGGLSAVHPMIVGSLLGMFVGGFWTTNGLLGIMMGESSITNMRASLIAAQTLVATVSAIFANIIPIVLLFVTGNNYPSFIRLILFISVPCFILPEMFVLLKTNETLHADLNRVNMEE